MSKQLYKQEFGVCLLLVFFISGCNLGSTDSAKLKQFSYSDWIMGTTFSIKVPRLPENISEEQLKADIMTLLLEIDGQMSTYKKDSELSRINTNISADAIALSRPLFTVIREAQRLSELSSGAFDITVGKLVNLWGFGPDQRITAPPSDQLIELALEKTGHVLFVLDEKNLTITKLNPNIYLDLSALAKGYAVDRVTELLESKLIDNYMVEIGGELSLKGHNSKNRKWQIAIEKPTAEAREIQTIIVISDTAIASSGNYRNFFEQDGQRYSHTIDPRTGRPITHKLVAVTVLSESTMTADGLATAFMVLGADKALALAEQEKMQVLFYIKSDNGFIEQSSTAYQNSLEGNL